MVSATTRNKPGMRLIKVKPYKRLLTGFYVRLRTRLARGGDVASADRFLSPQLRKSSDGVQKLRIVPLTRNRSTVAAVRVLFEITRALL